METIDTIAKRVEELKPVLREKYGVKSIGIFGSYPKGRQKRGSDLDVLVEFSETMGLFKFIELEYFLSEELGIKIDLVMKDGLKPQIREGILKEVIYL